MIYHCPPTKPVARKIFGELWEDYPPRIIDGVLYPGSYRVTIDGWYAGWFNAVSRDIAIKQFNAGLYER